MKSIDDLKLFYNSSLQDELVDLNKQRLLVVSEIKKIVGLGLIAIAIGVAIFYVTNVIQIMPIPLVLVVIYAYFKLSNPIAHYKQEFKSRIIHSIIKFIDNSLQYFPTDKLSRDFFQKCGIFKHRIDRYNGDDLVTGTLGATQVEFSEIHAEYKTTTTDSKGRTSTQWHTIFKGLLFSADFNKNFNINTFVLTDTAEKLFGFLGKKLQSISKSHGDLVSLENPEFEKSFVVYSRDQIEARYLLTPVLMEKILEFKNKSAKNIQLSFVDSRLFVTLPYSRDLFEPKIFGEIIGFENIRDYYEDLNLAVSLVEELNLNTRIWTKD